MIYESKNIRIRLKGILQSKEMPNIGNFIRIHFGFTLTELQRRQALSMWLHQYHHGIRYLTYKQNERIRT